tara:strand:+ start:427 stop:681 length:255 start_codon:yes stop_codon:yes gene_type:complete
MVSMSTAFDPNTLHLYQLQPYGVKWRRLVNGTTYTHTASGATLSVSKDRDGDGYTVQRDGVTLEGQDRLPWVAAMDLVRDWIPS